MILGVHVSLCEGEQSVKSYQCTEFESKFYGISGYGYVEVTNKRLLFQTPGQNSKGWVGIHNEVAITEVSDIKIYKGSTFSLPMFLIGLIGALIGAAIIRAGIASLTSEGVGTLLGLATLGYLGYLVYNWAKKDAFSIIISTRQGEAVVALAGVSPFNSGGIASSKSLISNKPSTDTDTMIREIGAVILDVQTLGDFAVQKWNPNA
ncbi:hypothetical protein [Spirosoma sp. KUDC1026]|uniref:hypothetical protein n=1 Tax=Spirosoma sp. KUDC1026 TaxID=2745947 RepID=UPI00159BB56C|nr:hypothetical protein [Spirosoma sp. KUDC1026]QKZ13776.1 hypothetical protein HU175_14515 [Spirosoma sp. KUDC1026]